MAASENVDAKRDELTALEHRAEQQRQAAQRQRRGEVDVLASAQEEHARQADAALTARSHILKELSAVRGKVQDKMQSTRAKGSHNVGAADRALARAGRRALDSKLEADRWQARAASEEERTRRVLTSEEEHLARLRRAMDIRVAGAQARGAERVALGQGLVDETSATFEQIRQRHAEHSAAQAGHAERAAALQIAGCHTARRQCAYDVNVAIPKMQREKMACIQDVQKSRDEANQLVAAAHLDLHETRSEAQSHKETQRVCSAQARKIASTLCEQTEGDRWEEQEKLKDRLGFVVSQAGRKGDNYAEEVDLAERRKEQWDDASNRAVALAQARSDGEAAKAAARVQEAKAKLSNLQAKCAAYIRSVMDQWEEARAIDAAKVQAATERTDALKNYCDRTLQECRQQWADKLAETDRVVKQVQQRLEDKLAGMTELHKQRVSMVHEHAHGWRTQAEAHLEAFQQHAKDVHTRQVERVNEETKACEERVALAKARYIHRAELAAWRTAEAEARRDKALAEYTAVMARIAGAAQEARRRGLDNIADIIEPPGVALGVDPWHSPGHAGLPMAEEYGEDAEAAVLKIQSVHRGNVARQALGKDGKSLSGVALGATSSTSAPPDTAGAATHSSTLRSG